MNNETSARRSFDSVAIVIIDMLNEYLDPHGKVYCDKCGSIVAPINHVITFADKHDILVIFNNTELTSKDDPMVKKWGLHAERGKWGSQLFGELKEPKRSITVPKKAYNGFFQTDLDHTLKSNQISSVVICGIHTHVCVLITATAAFEYGYDVDVLGDCITTGYQPNHDTRIRYFGTHVGRVISSEEWMRGFPSG